MKLPRSIGRYRIVRRIGAGGMGVVYEATDSRDGQRVALKVLLPHAAEEHEGLSRFKREFRALARLRHPNVVRVFDAGIDDDTPFIAMEFVEGRDAKSHLLSFPEGPARDREIVRVFRQIFGALAHVHSRRIVHRDLKPENVLVTTDGRVKLMDFGVAHMVKVEASESGLLGTFAYMAPEQVTSGEIDGRADLYALGIFLYEILTGTYPFPVEPPAAALHHHVDTVPDAPERRNPRVDPALAALATRLVAKDPLDRPQTAQDAAVALAKSAAAVSSTAEPSVSIPGQLFVPKLVAREADIARIEARVAALSEGRGGFVLLEGASGIGKSRVIDELRSRARHERFVLFGHTAPEQPGAYGSFLPIFDGLADLLEQGGGELEKKVLTADAALVGALSPRLAARIRGAEPPGVDPQERKLRLHKVMVGLLGRLSLVRPLVLIVEDIHWADALSLELLWDVARTLVTPRGGGRPGETVCPIVVILTRRSLAEGLDHSDALVRRLEERGILERRALEPLEAVDTAEMVRTMLGVKRVPDELLLELMGLSRGLPLMVQEIVNAWFAEGLLARRREGWTFRGEPFPREAAPPPPVPDGSDGDLEVTTPGPTPLPDESSERPRRAGSGVHLAKPEVVLVKLQGLAAEVRGLVERLALLGRVLPADLVTAVAGMGEDELLDAIDELVRHQVLVEDVTPGGVFYRFHHDGLRDAVARSLSRGRRQEIHLALAVTLERSFRRRRRDLAHVLARHFRHGGQPERAIRYLRFIAREAASRGDLEGAEKKLEDAIAIVEDGRDTPAAVDRRLGLNLDLIDLLLDFGRAREALDRADPRAAVAARSPRVLAAELLLRRARCQFALGQLDQTLATLGRMPEPPASRSIGARAIELEGRARVARGEHGRARAVLEAAHTIALEGGLPELAETLDAEIGLVMLHQGDYTASKRRLENALAGARRRGERRAIGRLVGTIGSVQAVRLQTSEAIAAFREALELTELTGIRAEREPWLGALGVLLSDQGEDADARRLLEEALDIAREVGNRQGESTWAGELGEHELRLGRLDDASQHLRKSLAIAREIGFAKGEALGEIRVGALTMERDLDNLAEAREHVENGLELAEAIDNEEVRIHGLWVLGRVNLREGRRGAARDLWKRADLLAEASQNLRLRRRIRTDLERRA